MSQNVLSEISRRTINLSKIDETSIVWHNDILTVRSDKGLHLYEYSYNLKCLDKKLDFLESSIVCSKTSPASTLFSNTFLSKCKNMEVSQLLIDPSLWPHNSQIVQELSHISEYKWSPAGLINNNQYVLSVLNNVGNLEFFGRNRHQWRNIFNLTDLILDHFEDKLSTDSLENIKKSADALETSTMCWAEQLNGRRSCIFVSAQKNSTILFWQLKTQYLVISAELIGQIEVESSEIMTMLWIPLADKRFMLVCANIMGQIIGLECQIENDCVKHLTTHNLWAHKDRMLAKYLTYKIMNDKIVLIFNKHRHFIVQMFDNKFNVLSQFTKNVNDYRITSITNKGSDIYIGIVNCKIYKADIKIMDNNINVDFIPFEIKDTYPGYELYGISSSSNTIIYVAALLDRKILHRKIPNKLDLVFFTPETTEQNIEVSHLLNNPTEKFTNLWDFIEVIRYKVVKSKMLPEIDITQLFKDIDKDTYKLKVYYILTVFYDQLEKLIKNGSRGSLPETDMDVIREKILCSHAKTVINEIYNIYQVNNKLDKFTKETFLGAKKYLESYAEKHKVHVTNFLPSNMLNISVPKIEYVCQCCDEKLQGFSCRHKHVNMFCFLTLTPIESDNYFVCPGCSATARIELYDKDPMCLFCDLYLNSSD